MNADPRPARSDRARVVLDTASRTLSTPLEEIRPSSPLGPSTWFAPGVSVSIDRLDGSVLAAVVDTDDPSRAEDMVTAPFELVDGYVRIDHRANPEAQDHMWVAALTQDLAFDHSLPPEVEQVASIELGRWLWLITSTEQWKEQRRTHRRAFELIEAAATNRTSLAPPEGWPGAWPGPAERELLQRCAVHLSGEPTAWIDQLEALLGRESARSVGHPVRPPARGAATLAPSRADATHEPVVLAATTPRGTYEVAVSRTPESDRTAMFRAELVSLPPTTDPSQALLLVVAGENEAKSDFSPTPGHDAAVGVLHRPGVGVRTDLAGDCEPRSLEVHEIPVHPGRPLEQPSVELRLAATRAWLAPGGGDVAPLWHLGAAFARAGRLDQAAAAFGIGRALRPAAPTWTHAVAAIERSSDERPEFQPTDPYRTPPSTQPPTARWIALAATAWRHGL